MTKQRLHLEVITQEDTVYDDEVDMVLAPGFEGQIGILPGHIGLLTKLQAGELMIVQNTQLNILAVTGGLLNVFDNKITVMADSATRAEDIDVNKVEKAVAQAQETLKQKLSDRDFAIADADLRKAVLELKVAKKRRYQKTYATQTGS